MSKKLDKIIDIGTESYEVQATIAEQVENSLKIKEVKSASSSTNKSYNGKAETSISIVSADEGGYFKKSIGVPPVGSSTPTNTQVINYGDMSSIMATIAGSGWYSWKKNQLEAVVENGVNQHVGVVLGLNADISTFVSKNFSNYDGYRHGDNTKKYLPYFLYICTDTGNLYYGDCKGVTEGTNYRQIVNKAKELVSNSNSYTADTLKTTLDTIDGRLDVLEGSNTTPGSVNFAVKELSDTVDTMADTFDQNIQNNADDITDLNTWLGNIVVNKSHSTNKNIVKNAQTAANSSKLGGNEPAYYQRKIIVSQTDPTASPAAANCVENDIWIVWK